MRVLFVLKQQGLYGQYGYSIKGSGLYNSAVMCNDMVNQLLRIKSDVVLVVDNNGIDKVVSDYKPDVVFIEALWVVPSKFDILSKLHPNVTWIVRNHSAIPFLSGEGIAMQWLLEYSQLNNVFVGHNDEDTQYTFSDLSNQPNLFLPNFYPANDAEPCRRKIDDHQIDIGCFGAIRPLKNQLIQATAAIRYAELHRQKLSFHINATRSEMGGDAILSNLRELFAETDHDLVEHSWLPRDEFLALMRTMDIHMQVSMSETFNIVTADAVSCGVPVVVSPSIKWIDKGLQADPTSCTDIINKLFDAVKGRHESNSINRLQDHNRRAVESWREVLL